MTDIYRGSNSASGVLATADLLSLNATGGAEVTTVTNAPADLSTTKYMEVLSQGGNGTDTASIPSPTGLGWISGTQLEGKTIPAGNWSASLGISDSAALNRLNELTIRFFKRSSGGSYTTIGSILASGLSINATRTSVSFSAVALSAVSFVTGDKLYVDLFARSTLSGWSGQRVSIYLSNSATQGVSGDMEVVTPVAVAASTPASTLALMGVG